MSIFGNSDLFDEFENNESDTDATEDNAWDEVKEYKEENAKLKSENEELRRKLKILTQTANIKIKDPSMDGPIAQVMLFNNVTARHFCEDIKGYFHYIASQKNQLGNSTGVNPPQSAAIHFLPSKASMQKKKGRDERKTSKAFVVTNTFQVYNEHFYLDLVGEPFEHNAVSGYCKPIYDKAYSLVLDGQVEIEAEETTKVADRRTCFNCGLKDHQLNDCPSPRNFDLINQRRQEFQNRISNSPQAGSLRYHVGKEAEESDIKFSHFKPGIISDTLREALGISKFELPPYIYQMRWFGYPPGHLKEAETLGSGLSFYSGNNNHSKTEDVDEDEGTVDISKIIDYPGFNIAPGKGVVDNHRELGTYPMDSRQSKDVMVSYHKHKNEILRSKLDKESEVSRKRRKLNGDAVAYSDDVREVDMDTGDDGHPDKNDSQKNESKGETPQKNVEEITYEESTEYVEETVEEKDIAEMEEGELMEFSTEMIIVDEIEDLPETKKPKVEEEGDVESLLDGVEAGDLNEEELQIRRELILRQLEMPEQIDLTLDEDSSQDVILVGESDSSGNVSNGEIVSSIVKSQRHFEDDIVSNSSNFNHSPHNQHREPPPSKIDSLETSVSEHVSVSQLMPPMKEKCTKLDIAEESSSRTPESPPNNSCNSSLINEHKTELELLISSTTTDNKRATDGDKESLPVNNSSMSDTKSMDISLASGCEKETAANSSVPHRSKFAEGITQFDAFYDETKSRGVYKRLRNLFKNSPRRQNKRP